MLYDFLIRSLCGVQAARYERRLVAIRADTLSQREGLKDRHRSYRQIGGELNYESSSK